LSLLLTHYTPAQSAQTHAQHITHHRLTRNSLYGIQYNTIQWKIFT